MFCVCVENNVFLKKAMFFDTTSHMIYFDYKAYAFYQNKNYSCLCDENGLVKSNL